MDLNELITQPLGDYDIKIRINDEKIKIMPYEDLENYQSIITLLPRTRDAVVILYQKQQGYGHWVTLLRDDKHILFFDPLAYRPDKQLFWSERYLRKSLGQDTPHLSYILNDALERGFKVTFSEIKFQKETDSVNTCGRHVVSIIKYWMRAKNPSLKEYYKLMNQSKQELELQNYDLLVSYLTK